MGVVWRARDPELDRDVAVKVLRPEVATSAARSSEARARLKREAQAMAKLQHPNVIAVHEVGEASEQVFVVMELVEGGTLRQWLARRPRTVPAILEVFRQAGRGLAAAHAAGLVHRDFKPENVLVGEDDRARVTDFGLVGLGTQPVELDGDDTELGLSLTRTGTILGTPAYLAPEVLRGGAATAASDQFSFCVALYEALWSQPPFAGETVQELFANLTNGALVPPPRRPAVAAQIRRAITRGLAVDPRERWPSVDALLAELTVRRLPLWTVAVGAAAVGGLVLVGVRLVTGDAASSPPADAPPAQLAAPRQSAPVQLTNMGACADYPSFVDDKTIVFEHFDGTQSDLAHVPVAGGTPVKLDGPEVDFEAPAASGPGEVIVTRYLADRKKRLERVRVDGTMTPFGDRPPQSSDTRVVLLGDTLYYLRRDNAQLRRRRDGVDVEIANLPADRRALNVAASPDGRWLAIGTARTIGRCVVDMHNAGAMRCETDPTARGAPMLLGDSTHYLVGNAEGLWKRRLDGTGTPIRVGPDKIEGLTMTASRDGRTIVYSTCVQRSRVSVRAADGAVRDLMEGRQSELATRADGALAMVRYVSMHESLIAVRDTAGEVRELTPREQLVREPSWSADGQQITYRVAGTGGGIYTVDVTPLPPRRVSDATTDIAPVFTADGKIVVARYEADQASRLWILDPDTGTARRVDDRPAWPYDRDPISGRILVGDLSRHRLWLWDPRTGEETEVARGDKKAADFASFARDGKSLLVTWGKELWRLPVGGGEPVLLVSAAKGIVTLGRAVELPDGTVAFTQHFRAGDLFRLDLPAH